MLPKNSGFHYNLFTGLPCTCSFGRPLKPFRHYKHVRISGVEWNRFKKNPGAKFMAIPGAEHYIDQMNGWMHPDVDVNGHNDQLAPFLNKEFRAGRLRAEQINLGRPDSLHGIYTYNNHGQRRGVLGTYSLAPWGQWMAARQHPLRRGVNVLDPKFTIQDIDELSTQHQNDLNRQRVFQNYKDRLPHHGEIAHRWPNGWHVKDLAKGDDPDEAMEAEGAVMNHCIGNEGEHPFSGYSYRDAVRDGQIPHVYSLRDPKGMPHATFHFNPDDTMAEIHGYGNHDSALAKYAPQVREFLDQYHPGSYVDRGPETVPGGHGNEFENRGEEEFEPWWDSYYNVPGATDVDTWLSHANGEYYDDAPEEYSRAEADAHEHELEAPELYRDDPDVESIFDDLASTHTGSGSFRHFRPEQIRDVFQTMEDEGYGGEFRDRAKDWLANEHDAYVDPYRQGEGEGYQQHGLAFNEPGSHYPESHPAEKLFAENLRHHLNKWVDPQTGKDLWNRQNTYPHTTPRRYQMGEEQGQPGDWEGFPGKYPADAQQGYLFQQTPYINNKGWHKERLPENLYPPIETDPIWQPASDSGVLKQQPLPETRMGAWNL